MAKRWKTCFDLRANLISTKVRASNRKSTQALAKRSRKYTQVFNLRLLATPFDQGFSIYRTRRESGILGRDQLKKGWEINMTRVSSAFQAAVIA